MDGCCSNAACEIDRLRDRQRTTLTAVLAINAVMFLVEMTAGLLAGSTALLADSLDMLGDTLVYGFSLYVLARHEGWKAISALMKGVIMALFGFFVLAQAGYKLLHPRVPEFETIGLIGLLALLTNAFCLALLWRHRGDDINMRSVWICSRNDIFANVSVLVAGLGVWLTRSQWPDLLVGLAIAILFLRSAFYVIKDAIATYAAHKASAGSTSETLGPTHR